MGQISTVDARPLFTKTLIDVYKERKSPTGFLRAQFETKETSTKEVSIQVKRGTEFVAVDVFRGTEGNRNQATNSSEKIIVPPYYREYVDATQLRFYDVMFGQNESQIDEATFAGYVEEMTEEIGMLQDKIDRAIELQCSQVLHSGIVELASDTNIDFKRKAGSKVDVGGGNYWTTGTVDPCVAIEAGCVFLKTIGKAAGGTFNMIVGSEVLTAMLNNATFQAKANLRRIAVVDIQMPIAQAEAVGSVFHGEFSAGSYKVRIWTYPETYDDATGTAIPYVEPEKFILLPLVTRFKLAFAAVPKLIRDMSNAEYPEFIKQQKGAYTIGNYVDPRAETHIFDVKSAPIAIPVAVDQIYTAQVVA